MRSFVRAYGLALLTTSAAFALTRLTWPLLAGTPFVPFFGAIAITTHWGSARAGMVALVLALIGAELAYPPGGPSLEDPRTFIVFLGLAILANQVIAARKRAGEALRASEAELRATLEHVRESEEKLRRAQKLEAIGHLVAGVAHNFNNLLTVTMGHADVLLERHPEGDGDHADLVEIRRAAERGGALTRQLLAFGPSRLARTDRVDVNAVVSALKTTLAPVLHDGIRLAVEPSDDPATIVIDPNDLEQVLVNLVFNARDALASGGQIRVDVADVRLTGSNGSGEIPLAPGPYIRIRVSDDGIGMSPEVQAHLFEPFFTTKEVGQGTGLGLAFVHGIARQAGGFVSIDTAPAKGTVVSLYFPPAPAPPRAAFAPSA